VNKIIFLAVMSSVITLSGCQSSPVTSSSVYSQREFRKMTYCIGLSDTAMHAATSKKKGMVYPAIIECISQCTQYMLLANHFRKVLWSPFICQDLIAHVYCQLYCCQG